MKHYTLCRSEALYVMSRTAYSCATDENWDVLKYETMANLLMGEGISTSNLSLDYALYLSLTHSPVSVGVERSIIELNKP